MNTSDFLYRQKQKVKYHTARDTFSRLVAEINRFQPLVDLADKQFSIRGIDAQFDRQRHFFLLENFSLVQHILRYLKGNFIVELDTVFFVFDELKLRLETAEEVFIIREIFFENCYHFIVPESEVVVLDIGMNVGFASLFFASQASVSQVYSFEPFSQTYQAAQINFRYNSSVAAKVIPHNYGLSDNTQTIEVPYFDHAKGQNRSVGAIVDQEATTAANATTIKILAAAAEINRIIKSHPDQSFIIKMDCEGAEYSIFRSLGAHPIDKQIKGFMIEWHLEEPHIITRILQSEGFRMIKTNLGVKTGLIYAFR